MDPASTINLIEQLKVHPGFELYQAEIQAQLARTTGAGMPITSDINEIAVRAVDLEATKRTLRWILGLPDDIIKRQEEELAKK